MGRCLTTLYSTLPYIQGSILFFHHVFCIYLSCYFDSYRKSLCSKHRILVKFASEDVVEEIIVREGAVGSVSITVFNTDILHYQLLKIFVLCELTEIEEMLPPLPLHLKPGIIQNFRCGCPVVRCRFTVSGSRLIWMDAGLSTHLSHLLPLAEVRMSAI
jgi:hypothetical protein